MRASLEPKEQQIDNLKDQLLNLQKVFEKLMEKMYTYGDEVEKKNSKFIQLQKDLEAQKKQTAEKKKIRLKFAQDVYNIVNGTKKEKDYITGIKRLN